MPMYHYKCKQCEEIVTVIRKVDNRNEIPTSEELEETASECIHDWYLTIQAPAIDCKGANHTFASSPRVERAWKTYQETARLQVDKANAQTREEKQYVQKQIDKLEKNK